jgi:hypothetical protein
LGRSGKHVGYSLKYEKEKRPLRRPKGRWVGYIEIGLG